MIKGFQEQNPATFRTISRKTVKKFTFLFDVDDLGWYNYDKYTVV